MKACIFPVLASFASGGALLLDFAPAKATVIYSGIRNIDVPRPSTQGESSVRLVELFPGRTLEFGWFYERINVNVKGSDPVDHLGVGFDTTNSKTHIFTEPASPYSAGEIPVYQGAGVEGVVILRQCTYPDLLASDCQGDWTGGEGFVGYGYYYGNSPSSTPALYGWARINMPADFSDPNAVARLVDWAYQDDGSQIAMGEGISDPVPGPGPAMGAAAALAASRRLRRRVRQHGKPSCPYSQQIS